MELKGSKTAENLAAAFAGESQARNKYTYYASQARKDGYVQIAEIFEETAGNEKEHAKMWFKLLHDGMPHTMDNLKDAADGENYEWTDMYAEFAKVAKEEGFDLHRLSVQSSRRDRERTRRKISRSLGEHRRRSCLQKRRASQMAVRQLRPHPRRPDRSWCLPGSAIIHNLTSASKQKTINRQTKPCQNFWRGFFIVANDREIC